MKVLLINLTMGIGSTGKIVAEIKKETERAGGKAYVAYGFYRSHECDCYQIRKGGKLAVVYELYRIRFTGYHGYTSKRATQKLIGYIKEIEPDIINLHNIHSGYLNLPVLFQFLREFTKPIVWTIHDCWPFTGHCSYYSMIKCAKWKKGCYDCKNRYAYPQRYLFDRSAYQWKDKREMFTNIECMELVTPSKWLADEIGESFLKSYPVRVISNGINLNVFQYRDSKIKKRLNIENKKVILGVAMSWGKRKGLDDFFQLSTLLDDSYVIILIGLKKAYKEYPKIIPVGRTENQQQLAEFYSSAECFVNPSREETLGMTTIEAMACGIPVITYNRTAVSEPVGNDCGIILEEDRPEKIVEAIHLIENSNIDYRRVCRKHAEEHFNSEDCFRQYIELYQSLCKK